MCNKFVLSFLSVIEMKNQKFKQFLINISLFMLKSLNGNSCSWNLFTTDIMSKYFTIHLQWKKFSTIISRSRPSYCIQVYLSKAILIYLTRQHGIIFVENSAWNSVDHARPEYLIIKLPKNVNLSKWTNWRGITLLNSINKIISIIMHNRISNIPDAILRKEQARFRQWIIAEQSVDGQFRCRYMLFAVFKQTFVRYWNTSRKSYA